MVLVGVRPGRLHSGNPGRAVPSVCGHRFGLDGDLGDQCADAVAGALRHRAETRPWRRKAGILGLISRKIDLAGSGWRQGCRALGRRAFLGIVLLVAAVLLAGSLFKTVPTGFLPDEDQGNFIVESRLPDGASVNRTSEVSAQVEKALREMPG